MPNKKKHISSSWGRWKHWPTTLASWSRSMMFWTMSLQMGSHLALMGSRCLIWSLQSMRFEIKIDWFLKIKGFLSFIYIQGGGPSPMKRWRRPLSRIELSDMNPDVNVQNHSIPAWPSLSPDAQDKSRHCCWNQSSATAWMFKRCQCYQGRAHFNYTKTANLRDLAWWFHLKINAQNISMYHVLYMYVLSQRM